MYDHERVEALVKTIAALQTISAEALVEANRTDDKLTETGFRVMIDDVAQKALTESLPPLAQKSVDEAVERLKDGVAKFLPLKNRLDDVSP